jgi:malonyl CoA-acyl carrier protein transacylase/phosphopantetheinyl transferase
MPDAAVGHSSGEFVALVMAGIVRFGSEEQQIKSIADGNLLVRELIAREDIPEASLLSVGGMDPSVIDRLLAKHPDQLLVAMSNCPHQYVLCAAAEVAQVVTDVLAANGGVVSPLPFKRPYHTPWFEPALDGIRDHFRKYAISAPDIDLYSCATADVFPADAAGIRELGTIQWAKPVRFQETIEKMYQRGYRIFVEIGPRGNLTAFVGDILRGRPHLSVATDRTHRSAITQLNHALGMLAAHGVPMNPSYLHAHRLSRAVDPKMKPPASAATKGMKIEFSSMLPRLRVEDLQRVKPPPEPAKRTPARKPAAPPAAPTVKAVETGSVSSVAEKDVAAQADISAYFDTMQEFLSLQKDISNQFLGRSVGARQNRPNAGSATIPSVGHEPFSPLLGREVEIVDATSLLAVNTLDVNEETFLKDHTFGTGVSVLDPELTGFPVLPLTMTLEVLGEAAAALVPGKVVVGFENIRATQWIAFEDGRGELRVDARVEPAPGPVRVRAAVREPTAGKGTGSLRPPIAEATVLLADDYAETDRPSLGPLKGARRVDWTRDDIYPERLFHGPQFQCIKSVSHWAENGMQATVEVLPRTKLIRSAPRPAFVIDPVLLDGIGAILGLWGAYETLTGAVFFPFSVESIRFGDGLLPPGTQLGVELRIREQSDIWATADIYAFADSTMPYVAISGWQDRAFDVTPAMHRVSHRPVDRYFSDFPEWSSDPNLGIGNAVCCMSPAFAPGFFESSHQVWKKVLTFVILNVEEREQFKAMSAPPPRKLQWLFGRAVAKDAARRFLLERDGLRLAAADITIRTDSNGRPYADGEWRSAVGEAVELSIAHSKDLAVAVAGSSGDGRLGVDVEFYRDLDEAFYQGAFSDMDRRTVSSLESLKSGWGLRLWCAKEALSKALGVGMRFDPRDLTVADVVPESGQVAIRLEGSWLGHVPSLEHGPVSVGTIDAGGYFLALCRIVRDPES